MIQLKAVAADLKRIATPVPESGGGFSTGLGSKNFSGHEEVSFSQSIINYETTLFPVCKELLFFFFFSFIQVKLIEKKKMGRAKGWRIGDS